MGSAAESVRRLRRPARLVNMNVRVEGADSALIIQPERRRGHLDKYSNHPGSKMSDDLLVVTGDLKLRKYEITPLRLCICDTLTTPQGNSHDGRAEIESRGRRGAIVAKRNCDSLRHIKVNPRVR
jgi:hypothetical protein